MNRRRFLQKAAPLAAVPFFSNSLVASVVRMPDYDAASLLAAPVSDRVLVIVQLNGGNDGLNMVLPLDVQYDNLALARPNIIIPKASIKKLGTFETGLHPAMDGLRTLYDEKHLTVIQGVSYATPDFSHFRATDIWLTGANYNEYLTTGWAGRFLQYQYPTFPDGYPSTAMPDPLAIQIGSNLSTALQGNSANTGQPIPSSFNGDITQLQSAYTNSVTPATPAGVEATYLRQQQAFANQYRQGIINAWNAGTNSLTYPATPAGVPNNALGQQLRIVARLVKGGLKTKVFFVSSGSFDTHADQVVSADRTTGYHAGLLKELSDAIRTFQTDLTTMGIADRVMGLTFSEFGRRVKSNASSGTDHGVAAPMFVFGNAVNPAVLGANAVIPTGTALTTNTQVPTQFDFRQVYRSVLQDWFCVPAADVIDMANTTLSPSGAVPPSNCNTTLPLDLLKFTVAKDGPRMARLTWTTANESNVSHFEYQRSADVRRFETIGRVTATGHSHEQTQYEATDADPGLTSLPTWYYRLKMIDRDGTFSYSPTRSISFTDAGEPLTISVFPNPATDGFVTIQPRSGITEAAVTELALADMSGRSVLTAYERLSVANPFTLQLFGISAGTYVLTVRHEGQQVTQKVVVQ
jgi:uncharacterized protein (DUF1501 family)